MLTFDPATGVPTGEVLREYALPDAALPRLAEIELGGRDVNMFTELAPATAGGEPQRRHQG